MSNIFISNGSQSANLFLPYGVLLFALWNTGLIPEIEEMLVGRKKLLKKVVVISTVAVSVFYLVFTLFVVFITGSKTDQLALIGLKNFLGDGAVTASLIAGILAVASAYIASGIVFKKTLIFDLKMKHWQAFVITCFTPMILFLLGFSAFIPIMSFVGTIILGITGIMILLMYKKIGGKNIVIYPLSVIFLLGIIYEIIYLIK